MTSAPATPPLMGDWTPLVASPQPKPETANRMRTAGHWLRDTGLGITGFILVLIVALAGWAASFIGLHDFGERHMGLNGDTAWLVPITFDGAAAGLSLVVFRASINGRGASTWRILIVVFTALSSWINWAHLSDPTGRWIASYMPPAAVVLFEGLMSEARAAASRRLGRERPRLHPLRWLIDRKGTWAMYRAYVLGIDLPQHLKQAASGGQEQTAKTPSLAAKNSGQNEQQERTTVRQQTAKKPAPAARQEAAKKPRQSAAKKRRSMDEWVRLGTPVFHAEFQRLRRQPSGTEFAKALAEAGHGKPSASTAKNIKTEILDRAPLPSLDGSE